MVATPLKTRNSASQQSEGSRWQYTQYHYLFFYGMCYLLSTYTPEQQGLLVWSVTNTPGARFGGLVWIWRRSQHPATVSPERHRRCQFSRWGNALWTASYKYYLLSFWSNCNGCSVSRASWFEHLAGTIFFPPNFFENDLPIEGLGQGKFEWFNYWALHKGSVKLCWLGVKTGVTEIFRAKNKFLGGFWPFGLFGHRVGSGSCAGGCHFFAGGRYRSKIVVGVWGGAEKAVFYFQTNRLAQGVEPKSGLWRGPERNWHVLAPPKWAQKRDFLIFGFKGGRIVIKLVY